MIKRTHHIVRHKHHQTIDYMHAARSRPQKQSPNQVSTG